MKAKSIKGKSPEEIQSALKQSMADGFKPTLAIVFISIKQDRKAICEILHNTGIDILGATSAGEFIDGYQDEGSVVILLLDLKPESYTILIEDVGERNQGKVSTSIAEAALKKFANPAFILCSTSLSKSGEFFNGETLVRSIEQIVGPNVNIYGGMAGDDGTFTGTFVFNREKSTDNGIAVLVLDEDKISLHGMAISGWKPLGIARTVTKSKGRLIYTIDNQAAVDMYLKYLGNEKFSDEDKYKMFEDVGSHYPFQVKRDIGDPAMVTPLGIDKEENALICESDVQEGSVFHFSMPPDFDIVETVLEAANELKKSSQANADALLIFSCIGRRTALGPFATSENEGLSKIWNSPMAGFFTYGEYGRAVNGRQEHHSTTCSWVALKEK
jgi:hypothetical protein